MKKSELGDGEPSRPPLSKEVIRALTLANEWAAKYPLSELDRKPDFTAAAEVYEATAAILGESGAAQEVSPPSPVCKAQRTGVGANDPIDCDWPFCGCDPKADKVIEAIQESGFEIVKTGGDTRELKAALRWIPVKEKLPPVEQDVLVWVKFEGYNEWQWTDSWLDQDGTWALGSAERYTVSHWRHVLNPTESERLLG